MNEDLKLQSPAQHKVTVPFSEMSTEQREEFLKKFDQYTDLMIDRLKNQGLLPNEDK